MERSVVFEGFYKIKITHSNVLSVLFMIRTGIYEKKDSSNHQAVIFQYSMLMLIIQVVNHHDFITYKTQYLNTSNDQLYLGESNSNMYNFLSTFVYNL